jgi:hypothetical protein
MLTRIWRGPFRSARIVMNPRNSLRKIFGLYEHELNDWLEQALRWVSRVVDVGANDGYFTFGSAAPIPATLPKPVKLSPARTRPPCRDAAPKRRLPSTNWDSLRNPSRARWQRIETRNDHARFRFSQSSMIQRIKSTRW